MSAHRTALVARRAALAAVLGSVALGVQLAGVGSASAAVVPAGHSWQAVVADGHSWQAVVADGHSWQ